MSQYVAYQYQLHATLPLHVFISPNMPIDDNNNVVHQGLQSTNASATLDDLIPPQYGEHQFDQLYSDIDPSGYMTPSGSVSGISTPCQSRSRSVSAENLASLDGVAANDLATNVLQTRLSNLNLAGSNRNVRDRAQLQSSQLSASWDTAAGQTSPGNQRSDDPAGMPPISSSHAGYFDHHASSVSQQDETGAVSRRGSEEDEAPRDPGTPQHIEYSAKSLAKVPSYTTALQSQPRPPVNDGLPTYQNATQTPLPSPSLPRPPAQVHVHRTVLRGL